MNVAIVHDCLCTYGDAERVLQVLHRMYPHAPVYTAFVDWAQLGAEADRFRGWEIRTTWAHRLPSMFRQRVRVWLPYLWESIDLSGYELVISSSGELFSQAVLTGPNTLHVSYCHTPPRALWEPFRTRQSAWTQWVNTPLRHYDVAAAQRVDRFVTTSERAARRIRKFYRRPVEVIPPPVKIAGDGQPGQQYYLYVGELTAAQQVEQVVAACTQLDRPLWVVGTGPERDRLASLAGPSVRFLGRVADADLPEIYQQAKALIFPCADADFGFSPVEAMGYGVPVIASEHSGIREVVLNYRTGLLFSESSVEGLCQAIAQFESLRFFPHACIQRAEEFAESVFISKLEWFIAQAIDEAHPSPTAI